MRLLAIILALVIGVELVTVVLIDRSLAGDLVSELDGRLEKQARAAAGWMTTAQHPAKFAHRAAALVDAHVTIVDPAGMVVGDSERQPGAPRPMDEEGTPVEIEQARATGTGRATAFSRATGQVMHHVAARGRDGLVVRLSVPLASIDATRARARQTVLVGASVGLALAIVFGLLAARWQMRARFEELRRAEEIRRKFLADAAHELRTPTAAIQGYAQTLDGADEATQKECAEVIERHARRMSRLVADMLLLSDLDARARPALREPIEVDRVIAQVARTTGAKLDVQADKVLARGDPERLEHSLENLVDNAVKYGGPRIQVSARAAGERVEVVVEDDGAGIPAEHLPRLFERFYRVDAGRSRDKGGAGLGLALVKELVESMGGSVRVASDGRGTRFTLDLPGI